MRKLVTTSYYFQYVMHMVYSMASSSARMIPSTKMFVSVASMATKRLGYKGQRPSNIIDCYYYRLLLSIIIIIDNYYRLLLLSIIIIDYYYR